MSGDQAYLTAEQAREYITTTLGDDELDSLLLGATQEIEAPDAWGPTGSLTETHRASGALMRLNHTAAEIEAVIEDVDGVAQTLSEDDYEIGDSGDTLRRLHTGTHPRRHWSGRVRITYSQPDDMSERTTLLVQLVEQDLNYAPGLGTTQIAQWREDQANNSVWNYRTERAMLLRPKVTW